MFTIAWIASENFVLKKKPGHLPRFVSPQSPGYPRDDAGFLDTTESLATIDKDNDTLIWNVLISEDGGAELSS